MCILLKLIIFFIGPNYSSLSTMDDSTCDILGLFNRSIFYFSPTAASSHDIALDLSQKHKTNARLTAAVYKCSPIQVFIKIIYLYCLNGNNNTNCFRM